MPGPKAFVNHSLYIRPSKSLSNTGYGPSPGNIYQVLFVCQAKKAFMKHSLCTRTRKQLLSTYCILVVEDIAETITDQVPSWEGLEILQNWGSDAAFAWGGSQGVLHLHSKVQIFPVNLGCWGNPCDTPKYPHGSASVLGFRGQKCIEGKASKHGSFSSLNTFFYRRFLWKKTCRLDISI